MQFIGLLSGTSMDCIDVGLFNIEDSTIETLHHCTFDIPEDFKQECISISTNIHDHRFNNIQNFGKLNTYAGKLFAAAVNKLITSFNIDKNNIQGIGFCGQTIWHEPNNLHPFSIQIGDPSFISVLTALPVYTNFRQKHIALGGEGAPLAPYLHDYIFSSKLEDRIILNIGGISNLTILPKNKAFKLGFDCGPGNCLIDQWVNQEFNLKFDDSGKLAATGKLIPEMLQSLLDDPYFKIYPPTSTGREYFNLDWVNNRFNELHKYSNIDILHTLTVFTTEVITRAIKQYKCETYTIYLCGGGNKNTFLKNILAKSYIVKDTNELGIDPDMVEAALFAWLAYMSYVKQPSIPHGARYTP